MRKCEKRFSKLKWEKDSLPHLGDFFVQVGHHVYGPSSSGQVLHHFHQHTSQPFAFNLLFFPPRKAFCQLSKRKELFYLSKRKELFLKALWQSPASLSLAQQLLLFCLGPEKDPDKSCDTVFYHELHFYSTWFRKVLWRSPTLSSAVRLSHG